MLENIKIDKSFFYKYRFQLDFWTFLLPAQQLKIFIISELLLSMVNEKIETGIGFWRVNNNCDV